MANILTRLRNSIRISFQAKDSENKFAQAFYSLLGFGFTQYDPKDKTYVEKGYNENPDVFSIINQKANQFNRIPYYIKKVKNDQSKSKYIQLRGYSGGQVQVKRSVCEVSAFDEKELPLPMKRPNVLTTWSDFFAMYETFMDLTGNFYMYLLRPKEGPNAGTPIQIYVLPSHLMEIVLKPGADTIIDESPISHYMLREGEQYIKFEAYDVIHVRKPNPNYSTAGTHLYGQSPLRALLKNIQSSNEALDLNRKTLANGGVFGFISTKEPLTAEQAQQLKERLVEMDNSPKRLSNIAGSAKEVVFTRISLTTKELAPFEYLKYDQKAIANALGWEDKLLNNDDGVKYDNYNLAMQRAIQNGLIPNIRLLEDALNNSFLPLFKGYENTVWLWDESELPEMQADMEKLTSWLNNALDRGVITRDEYRSAIKYPQLGTPEMQTLTVGMNVLPLEEALIPDTQFNIDEQGAV